MSLRRWGGGQLKDNDLLKLITEIIWANLKPEDERNFYKLNSTDPLYWDLNTLNTYLENPIGIQVTLFSFNLFKMRGFSGYLLLCPDEANLAKQIMLLNPNSTSVTKHE